MSSLKSWGWKSHLLVKRGSLSFHVPSCPSSLGQSTDGSHGRMSAFSDLMGPEPGQRKRVVQPAQLGQQTSLWGLSFPLPAHHRGLAEARAGRDFLDLSLQPVASPKPGIPGQAKVCLPCCEQLGAGQKAQAEQGAGIEKFWENCLGPVFGDPTKAMVTLVFCSQGLLSEGWCHSMLTWSSLQ